MTNKTKIDLYREYVRVTDMCDAYNKEHSTDIKPWECVRTCDGLGNVNQVFYEHPKFDAKNKDAYKFAIAILEGRPVWVGDKVYSTLTGHEYTVTDPYQLNAVTWTPPRQKRTFMLELDEKEIDFLTSLIDPSFYGCDPSVRSIRLKAQSLLTAARDKE